MSVGYCNLSDSDDVYHVATHVLIAYAIIDGEGGLNIDALPQDLID